MNLSISKESLVQLSFLTSSLAQKKGSMPILANVLLDATEDGKLRVVATDLEVSLKSEATAQVKTAGKVTVEAKVLYDIVKELPNFPITLNSSKKSRLEIECGQSRFKINCVSSDEYPEVQGLNLTNPATIKTKILSEMIDKTLYAVSTDETRFSINGIYAETIEGPLGPKKMCLRFVATDGHRMAIIDRAAEGFELKKSVIIPKKGIQELRKVLEETISEETRVSVDQGFLVVGAGPTTLGIRLVDGQYPDYKQVIPTDTTTKIMADRSQLLSAVKRVSLVTSDKSRAVKLKLVEGNLLVSSASPEYGEASENVEVKQDGQDVATGFSGRYLLDMLGSISNSSEVCIRLNGNSSPGVFTGDTDSLCEGIIMPMRFE